MGDVMTSDQPDERVQGLTTVEAVWNGDVLVVTLDRPDRLNAFDETMRGELEQLWRSMSSDGRLRAVVVTGRGRGFSSGADAGDLSEGVRAPAGGGVATALAFLPGEWLQVPVIAAVNGVCSGGGLHFVADADLVVASEAAWFNDPHVSVGQVSALEPLTLLGRVSWSVAVRMVLLGTGVRINATDALASGLVDEVLPAEQLLPRARELAATIARQSPAAVRQSLRLMRKARRHLVEDLLEEGWDTIVRHWEHPDADEGPRAFMEKRKPEWGQP
jgi:enoyl-CoA hydratase/carnithine racemase